MSSYALIQNASVPLSEPPRVRICRTFGSRLRGFMFHAPLGRDEGLLLVMPRESRLNSGIHMLFVNFDLAVFWIDDNLDIVDKVLARSWHAAYVPSRRARSVLEIHPSLLSAFEIGNKVDVADA